MEVEQEQPSDGKKKGDISERLPRKKRTRDGGPRFPVHYIKAQMKLLGCKKVSGTVPHMVAGILGCFCDEVLSITNEAATAEVRIKKRKQGCTPRLAPTHMTFVKKSEDFQALLSNVHFRNVWSSSSHATVNTTGGEPVQPDPNALLACEKQPKRKKHRFVSRVQQQRSRPSVAASTAARTAASAAATATSAAARVVPGSGKSFASSDISRYISQQKRQHVGDTSPQKRQQVTHSVTYTSRSGQSITRTLTGPPAAGQTSSRAAAQPAASAPAAAPDSPARLKRMRAKGPEQEAQGPAKEPSKGSVMYF